MDEKQQQVLSSKVSADEAEIIKRRAAALGISVSEFLRIRALADIAETSSGNVEACLKRLEALVKHGIYITNQVYAGLFSIAEAQSRSGRFLSLEELQTVYDQVRKDTLVYAVEFPEHFEKVQTEIAALAKKEQA